MKNNNQTLALIGGLLIFVIVGYIAFLQLAPKSMTTLKPAAVEKISPVDATYSTEAMNKLSDSQKIKDYYVKPDIKSGLGSSDLFAPLK